MIIMQAVLKQKLWAYIVRNNPDLMVTLQEQHSTDKYLEDKVANVMPIVDRLLSEGAPLHIVEELSMDALTTDLKPSRYHYMCSILEEEFPNDFDRLKEGGTLLYEVCNMIAACNDIFEEFDFNTKNEDNRFLKYAVIGQIHDYLA